MRVLNKVSIVFCSVIVFMMLSACEQINTQKLGTHSITKDRIHLVNSNIGVATFAGGCFWCTEADFDKMPGVLSTTSGYIGGELISPTYDQISSGKTGHIEAVQIHYDSTKTNFTKLLTAYWQTIDPLTPNRQFCDGGSQYRSVVFYHDSDQKKKAEKSKAALVSSGRFSQPIVTEIKPATEFYQAEDYHQDYYIKNPIRYTYYRSSCGRDERLKELWGNKL
jgi:peptide-methionine (S)-S-oxide reductase